MTEEREEERRGEEEKMLVGGEGEGSDSSDGELTE